jgi:hypothetical protein
MPTNPYHQPETECKGDLQEFSGPALSPEDPTVAPRVRKGRPSDRKPETGEQQDKPPQKE